MKGRKILFYMALTVSIILTSAMLLVYKSLRSACSRPNSQEYKSVILKKYNYLATNNKLKEINLKTKDNINLSAILIERPNAKRVIILCHGRWQSKEFMHNFVDMFDQDTILIFDFRSHGSSEGDLITMGLREAHDIEAGIAFLKQYKDTKNLPIIGIGISMGGASLIRAASQSDDIKAIVIDSAYSRLNTHMCNAFVQATKLPACMFGISKCFFEFMVKSKIERINPINYIKLLTIPVLIIHSKDDKTIPVQDSYDLYQAIPSDKKELWVVDSAKHGKIHKKFPIDYKNKVESFLNKFGE